MELINSYDFKRTRERQIASLFWGDGSARAAHADQISLNGHPIAVLDPSTATLSFLHDDRLGEHRGEPVSG